MKKESDSEGNWGKKYKKQWWKWNKIKERMNVAKLIVKKMVHKWYMKKKKQSVQIKDI